MHLRFMLDTNICIYIAKNHPKNVLQKFQKLSVGEVGMSTITYGELMFGCQKSKYTKKTKAMIKQLASLVPVLPIPIEAGEVYGEIRSKLKAVGKPIGNNDLWIAAHAISMNLTFVSNNLKEFARIKKLKLENWIN